MWQSMRKDIIENFTAPEPITKKVNAPDYLTQLDDKFVSDAYHSLSIEGYKVSLELIEHVRGGNWNPQQSNESKQPLDAMAAKGYWDAFVKVKSSVEQVLKGSNAGEILEQHHLDWYLALFGPSVVAGIVKQTDLAGYRTGPVFIRQSKHTPPSKEALRDMMPTFFDLLIQEDNAAVRIVLGHFLFVYIHPYIDGNGRIGRFIMNVMMASAGYPWTVVPVQRRHEYMQTLESASVDGDIVPFTRFIASLL